MSTHGVRSDDFHVDRDSMERLLEHDNELIRIGARAVLETRYGGDYS